jgi:hypothetical protein
MAHKTDLIARLPDANDAQTMYDVLLESEQTVLYGKKPVEAPED